MTPQYHVLYKPCGRAKAIETTQKKERKQSTSPEKTCNPKTSMREGEAESIYKQAESNSQISDGKSSSLKNCFTCKWIQFLIKDYKVNEYIKMQHPICCL